MDYKKLEKRFDKLLSKQSKEKIYEWLQKETKVPIYRGCKNEQCFCSGQCQEIIGYRDKLIGEK